MPPFPTSARGGRFKASRPSGRLPTTTPIIAVLLAAVLFIPACGPDEAEQPSYVEVVELAGTPYERGYQHGKKLAGKIRSLYTRWLSAGVMPWFNREHPELSQYLVEYQKPLYSNGQFAYQAMLQSGENLLTFIPEPYQEELRGVSDGSGVPFERILILNTFFDALFGMRAVLFVIKNLQEPNVVSIEFQELRDGEWTTIGLVAPYEPSPCACMTEVPVDARIRIVIQDPEGVDPDSIRIQLGDEVYFAGHPSIATTVMGTRRDKLEVLFTPPRALPPARVVALQIQASDLDVVYDPPPVHPRVMRDERITFTTEGYGVPQEENHTIPNIGAGDERLQPTSISFAVRGAATSNNEVLAAHHFVGLDNDTAHKHTVVFIHRPDSGRPHVTVGLAGIIWGSSGMNSDGLVCSFNLSDTLDNPVALEFLTHLLEAKMISSGVPIGIILRELLAKTGSVEEAGNLVRSFPITLGFNVLLADAGGSLAAVELDSNILCNPDRGYYVYRPEDPEDPDRTPSNFDPWGRPWASVGPDDLRMAMHYQANSEDIRLNIFRFPLLYPQRFWTTYYFRSLRSFYLLGDAIGASYGKLDVPGIIRILREPDLNDKRNSMNAAIFAPQDLKLWYALGEVPATSAPFRELDFKAMIGKK